MLIDRQGEDDDERVEEGLELRRHDQVDEEDRQGHGQHQRLLSSGSLLLLSAQGRRRGRGQRLPGDGFSHVGCDRPHVTTGEVAGDHTGPLLTDAANLARTLDEVHGGHRLEVDRDAFVLRHDEVLNVVDRGAADFHRPHHDVDLPIALREPGRHLSLNLVADGIGHVAQGKPQL